MEEHWQPYYWLTVRFRLRGGYRRGTKPCHKIWVSNVVWHLLDDIDWNKTKSEPGHIIWPSRYTRSGGQSLNSQSRFSEVQKCWWVWDTSWPAGSHGWYHTIIDRLEERLRHGKRKRRLDDLLERIYKIWNYFTKGNDGQNWETSEIRGGSHTMKGFSECIDGLFWWKWTKEGAAFPMNW